MKPISLVNTHKKNMNIDGGLNNMNWYNGTYTCGHQGKIKLDDQLVFNEFYVEKIFMKKCYDCRNAEFENYKQKKNDYSMEISNEMGLPALIGSEKQVAWATTLRVDFIKQLEDEEKELLLYKNIMSTGTYKNQPRMVSKIAFAEKLINELKVSITSETEAKTFIEMRDKLGIGIVNGILHKNNLFQWIWKNAISEEVTEYALTLELCTREDLTS